MTDALNVAMRWLHIASMAVLVGGMVFARLAWAPSLGMDPALGDRVAARFKPWVYGSIGGLLVSGLYNFLRKSGLTPAYHAVFGVKMLLAAHVFVVAVLIVRPGNRRRPRQIAGVVISAAVILLLSAVLRRLSG